MIRMEIQLASYTPQHLIHYLHHQQLLAIQVSILHHLILTFAILPHTVYHYYKSRARSWYESNSSKQLETTETLPPMTTPCEDDINEHTVLEGVNLKSVARTYVLEFIWTPQQRQVKCKSWTLDWTHGLDCGQIFGLMRLRMTTISNHALESV